MQQQTSQTKQRQLTVEAIEAFPKLLAYMANSHLYSEAMIRGCVQRGVDCSINSKHDRLIHRATEKQDIEMIKLLLQCGAKVDPRNESKITPLRITCERCEKGDVEIAMLLIENGADVNGGDFKNDLGSYREEKPIFDVIKSKGSEKESMFRFMIENEGIDLDTSGKCWMYTPLCGLIDHQEYDLADLLIDRGLVEINKCTSFSDAGNVAAIHCAAENPNLPFFISLIERGADITLMSKYDKRDAYPVFRYACSSKLKNLEIVRYLTEQKKVDINKYPKGHTGGLKKETPLTSAIESGDTEKIKYLLEQGARPTAKQKKEKYFIRDIIDSDGDLEAIKTLVKYGVVEKQLVYAVCRAVKKQNFEVVKYLCEELGQSVVQVEKDLKALEGDGLLHSFIGSWGDKVDLELGQYLIDNGADIEAVSHVDTKDLPIHRAAGSYSKTAPMEFLLKNGASVTSVSEAGHTTIHAAAEVSLENTKFVVERLEKEGKLKEQINKYCYYSYYPLSCARSKEVKEYLISKGAKERS